MILSPIEAVHAIIFKVASDIKNGMSDGELGIWRVAMLSVPFTYVVIDNFEKRYWASLELREQKTGLAEIIKRTPLERGHDVMEAKALLESTTGNEVSADTLAKAFASNANFGYGSEPAKKNIC